MRRIVTIKYLPNQGPAGPQGPPGAGVSLPLSSADVVYVPDGRTIEEIIAELIFVPMAINSFSTPQIVFEIGQIITSLTFSWALSKDPVTQTITGTNVTPPTLVPSDRSKTVSFSNLSSNGTVTLTVNDGNGPVVANIGLSFLKGVFTGVAPLGTIDNAFVNSLSKTLQASRQKTVSLNLTTSQYGWAVTPVAYGLPTFKVNGFDGGMTLAATIMVTNGYGHMESFYVHRTTNHSLGLTSIQIL